MRVDMGKVFDCVGVSVRFCMEVRHTGEDEWERAGGWRWVNGWVDVVNH